MGGCSMISIKNVIKLDHQLHFSKFKMEIVLADFQMPNGILIYNLKESMMKKQFYLI
jgi:hypothetical protein